MLDPLTLNQILMELDVLYHSKCENIIRLFGASFADGYVYYGMELMDASLDKVYDRNGTPEDIIAYVALSTLTGLRYLKTSSQ